MTIHDHHMRMHDRKLVHMSSTGRVHVNFPLRKISGNVAFNISCTFPQMYKQRRSQGVARCGQGHTNPTQRKIEMFVLKIMSIIGRNTLVHVNGQMHAVEVV